MSDKTEIMGILNITPDSFSDGGLYYQNLAEAVARAKIMVKEGADSIDIGGESTRPGSARISVEEELERVLPVIQEVKKAVGDAVSLSIDTYKAPVAKAALAAGATIVNSMGGCMFDPGLGEVVAAAGCLFIVYHIKGTPQTMQQGDIHYDNLLKEIDTFFEQQIAIGKTYGIKNEQYILDPGIGFGKTADHNLTLIRNLHAFGRFHLPILVGVSRKSHLGAILKDQLGLADAPPPNERLEAALAETAIAVFQGASIIRTHDVSATKKCVAIVDAIMNKEEYVDSKTA